MESEARGPRACDPVYFLYALNDIKPREADGHFILTPQTRKKPNVPIVNRVSLFRGPDLMILPRLALLADGV